MISKSWITWWQAAHWQPVRILLTKPNVINFTCDVWFVSCLFRGDKISLFQKWFKILLEQIQRLCSHWYLPRDTNKANFCKFFKHLVIFIDVCLKFSICCSRIPCRPKVQQGSRSICLELDTLNCPRSWEASVSEEAAIAEDRKTEDVATIAEDQYSVTMYYQT